MSMEHFLFGVPQSVDRCHELFFTHEQLIPLLLETSPHLGLYIPCPCSDLIDHAVCDPDEILSAWDPPRSELEGTLEGLSMMVPRLMYKHISMFGPDVVNHRAVPAYQLLASHAVEAKMFALVLWAVQVEHILCGLVELLCLGFELRDGDQLVVLGVAAPTMIPSALATQKQGTFQAAVHSTTSVSLVTVSTVELLGLLDLQELEHADKSEIPRECAHAIMR
mmetsp:Transcript_18971/g.55186  ORF Transcript_18971/g.55186 Transcript_18971/m.55186 type:complete len:222 (-) Transcript_18971:180-845(-)